MGEKAVTYEVSGRHHFPIDMLRYDRVTPATERDSGEIERSFDRNHKGPFTVTVTGSRKTAERWVSFGWVVK